MTLLATAIRTGTRHRPTDHLRAAVVTALGPAMLAMAAIWLYPKGCDLRGDPVVYRWTCLLPGLLIPVPVVVALVLPAAGFLARKAPARLPDGWLVTTLTVGLTTQVVLMALYATTLPAHRLAFLGEVFSIPQPFVAGAIAGAVYWMALNWRGRPSVAAGGARDAADDA